MKKVRRVKDLLGFTLSEARRGTKDHNVLVLRSQCGRTFRLMHQQSCCEHVTLEDIAGDLQDLVGSPLVMAEEESNEVPKENPEADSLQMWTFYKFATAKGYVTLRWYGESNGYYSVGVDLEEAHDWDECED